MRRVLPLIVAVAASGALASLAQAQTLGSTTQPSGSSGAPCNPNEVFAQYASDPSTPYSVPPGGGSITSFQTNTTGATPGQPVTFLVLAGSATAFTVVGVDNETIPNPLPASGIATFTPATPISAAAGDILGIYDNSSSGLHCYWGAGSTPSTDAIDVSSSPSTPTTGESLSPFTSGIAFRLNLSATLLVTDDVAVAATPEPASVTAGQDALLAAAVTSGGPNGASVTVTDAVPAGLSVVAAAVSGGTCTVAGQLVTCTTGLLAAGQSVPVDIVVSPTTPGSFTNTVSVSSPANDPNPANNSASAVLHAVAPNPPPVARHCVVPKLGGTPKVVATRVLSLLGCRTKVVTAHSAKVAKGLVIATKPGAGTYANLATIKVTVSSGRPPKKHRKK